MHILIIGAGAIGLTSAYVLAQAGHQVTVLDRGPAGAESTWAGAGILSPLLPWDYPPAVNDLARRGSQLWPSWAVQLRQQSGIDPEYIKSGMLVLDLPDANKARLWCENNNWPAATPANGFAPFNPRPEHSLWLAEVGQLRNPRLVQALTQSLLTIGGSIETGCPVLDLLSNGNQVDGVRTAKGVLQADAYILAAGAWSQSLLGTQAAGLTISPVRGQIVLFKTKPGLLPWVVYKDGHYLVPRSDGHILAGSTLELAGFDKETTLNARQELLAFANSVLPSLDESRIVRQWAGLRPGSPENIPTIGRHPVLNNLFANTGHFRYGVTMAPASAEILLGLVTGQPCPVDPRPYAWHTPDGN